MNIPPRHQHPIAIVQYTARYLILLLIPTLRSLHAYFSPEDVIQKSYYYIELIAFAALLLIPYILWRQYQYSLSSNAFHRQCGILCKRTLIIPRRFISIITIVQPWYLRPFHASHIYIDTDATGTQRAELCLTTGRTATKQILSNRIKHEEEHAHYHAHPLSIIALSVFTSNYINGLLFFSSVLYQTIRVLGDDYFGIFFHNVEAAATYLHILPYTTALITILLIIGRFVSAIRTCAYSMPFYAVRRHHVLTIRAGAITRRDYLCTIKSINFVDFRQTLFLKWLKQTIVCIHCIGYGRKRDMISLLIPVMPSNRALSITQTLLPEFKHVSQKIRPVRYSLWRYCRAPLLIIVLLYPLARICLLFTPSWRAIVELIIIALYIPCLWWLIVRIVGRYTTGIAHSRDSYTISYTKRWHFHTVVITRDKIIQIRIRQSPSQRRHAIGNVYIYTHSDRRCIHRVNNIPLRDFII